MTDMQKQAGERIAKFLARAGVASRRECERLIADGRIRLNGKILTTPAVKVTAKDKILFDNEPLNAPEPPRLWRYNKPTGLITAHSDPEGRPTVFDALPKDLPRIISVGRLDMNSEGLLLLTNDGELKRALELPSTGWTRKYRARAFGRTSQDKLDTLKDGIIIDGIPTGPIEAEFERQQGGNCWIAVMIREGKNREVRRALESLGLEVNRLIRVSYGPFQLGTLPRGQVEEVKTKILRDQVGHMVEIPDEITTVRGGRRTAGEKKTSGRATKSHNQASSSKKGAAGYRGKGGFAGKAPKPKAGSRASRHNPNPEKRAANQPDFNKSASGKPGGKSSHVKGPASGRGKPRAPRPGKGHR